MYKKRIIPCLDIKNGRVVKGINFLNLIILNFDNGLHSIYELPQSLINKKGVWLIGYDGFIKDYSENLDLLERVMKVIDEMPMRLNEIENKISTCKKV